MVSERFDRLAKFMSQVASRRAALRGLVASALGTGLGVPAATVLDDHQTALAKKGCNGNGQCKNPRNPCKKAVCRGGRCRKTNERNGKSCGNERVCQNGRCRSACSPVCTGGQVCQQAVCVCPESGECTITPSSLDGWAIGGTEPVQFAVGPESPPLGTGSVVLSTPAGGKATFRNQGFAGLDIADLETLSYSTFMENGSATGVVVPAVKLEVRYDAGSEFTTLIFEPTYSENSSVVADEWQSWDLLSADARWWSSRAIPAGDPEICAFDCFVSWQAVLDAIPDAFITAVLVETGSGTANAVGNADALNINGLIFNFEPDPQ